MAQAQASAGNIPEKSPDRPLGAVEQMRVAAAFGHGVKFDAETVRNFLVVINRLEREAETADAQLAQTRAMRDEMERQIAQNRALLARVGRRVRTALWLFAGWLALWLWAVSIWWLA